MTTVIDVAGITKLLNSYAAPGTTIEIGFPENYEGAQLMETIGSQSKLNGLHHMMETPGIVRKIFWAQENGYGKRTPVNDYRVQGRGGKGIISVKTTERNGLAVGFLQVREGDEIMLMAAKGKLLRCKVDDIREVGRNTQGVRVLDLDGDDDRVIGVARLAEAAEAASEDQPEA